MYGYMHLPPVDPMHALKWRFITVFLPLNKNLGSVAVWGPLSRFRRKWRSLKVRSGCGPCAPRTPIIWIMSFISGMLGISLSDLGKVYRQASDMKQRSVSPRIRKAIYCNLLRLQMRWCAYVDLYLESFERAMPPLPGLFWTGAK